MKNQNEEFPRKFNNYKNNIKFVNLWKHDSLLRIRNLNVRQDLDFDDKKYSFLSKQKFSFSKLFTEQDSNYKRHITQHALIKREINCFIK